MPMDVPLEASERLVFTPPCLSEMDNPPTFFLRAGTAREQRQQRRMAREAGLRSHSDEQMREATRKELKRLWPADEFDESMARVEAFWSALDDFKLQKADDPEVTFALPDDEVAAMADLTRNLEGASPLLRRMAADNADFQDVHAQIVAAVIIEKFEGLGAKLIREDGYLTHECVMAIANHLARICDERSKATSLAWWELLAECAKRLRLDDGSEKNSVSPSRSAPRRPNSSTGAAATKSGKSKASAPSPAKTSSK